MSDTLTGGGSSPWPGPPVPDAETLRRLAWLLGITVEELIRRLVFGAPPPPPPPPPPPGPIAGGDAPSGAAALGARPEPVNVSDHYSHVEEWTVTVPGHDGRVETNRVTRTSVYYPQRWYVPR